MFDIQLFDKPEILKLLQGSNIFTGFNTRLDIFTPLEAKSLSSILDEAYHEAEIRVEEYSKNPEVQSNYEMRRRYSSAIQPAPLPLKIEYLEGEEGPPLGIGINHNQIWEHPILKTIIIRDYRNPRGDYAYSNVREQMRSHQGNFLILPFSKESETNVIPNSIHNCFDFEPKSDAVLQFVLGMMNLYGNYSSAALEAKMHYITPTIEEGMAQRDAVNKLGNFFHDHSIPFYATFHNPKNNHPVLVYGTDSNGEKTVHQNQISEVKKLPLSSICQ